MGEDKYDWRSVLGRVRSAAENRSRVMAPAYLPWDGSCRTQRINGHFISGEDLDYLEADLDAANARADEARECIKALMLSMRLWGAEEDGIPDDSTRAWAAYSRAKCILCPEREAYRCTEYDQQSCSICEPCAACGKIRKHSFASFFMEDTEGHFIMVCNDTCARRYAGAREAVKHEPR